MKVLAIVPYPELGTLISESAKKYPDMELTTFVGYYGNAMAYLTTFPRDRFDIIITRGGTTSLLTEKAKIPVIGIHLTAIDIVRVIMQAKQLSLKTAVITYPDIADVFNTAADTLGVKLSVYPFESPNQIEGLVERCREDGCRVVIGGAMARDICADKGLQCILIASGREAIDECVALAYQTWASGRAASERASLFQEVTDKSDAPTLLYDENAKLRFANEAAWKLFGREEHAMKRIEENIPQLLKKGEVHVVQKIGSYYYKLSGHVLTVEGKTYCSFDLHFRSPDYRPASFTEIRSPEDVESVIRACPYAYLLTVPYELDIDAAMNSGLPVHIRGEVGTKKDLLAHIIHQKINSSSSFINISCRNVNEKGWRSLLRKSASPLYATSYTVFFEDVDMLPLSMQSELVSYIRDTRMDLRHRLVSCAHSDLSEAVAAGTFLSDLYRLLSGIRITMLPLSERRDEIPAFLNLLVPLYNEQFSRSVIGFSKEAMAYLTSFNWPLNLAQTETIVRQLVVEAKSPYISSEDVRAVLRNAPDTATLSTFTLTGTLEEIERRIITEVLKEENMNQSAAAKRLGIGRSTLWRKLNSNQAAP